MDQILEVIGCCNLTPSTANSPFWKYPETQHVTLVACAPWPYRTCLREFFKSICKVAISVLYQKIQHNVLSLSDIEMDPRGAQHTSCGAQNVGH